MFLIDLQIYVSSVNRPIVDETVEIKSNGPSTAPCETPGVTADTDDVTLATAGFKVYSPEIFLSIEGFFLLYHNAPFLVIISDGIVGQRLC